MWPSCDSFTRSIETFLDTYFRVEAYHPGSKAHLIISVRIKYFLQIFFSP